MIDPTLIRPECRYSTGEAAALLELTPGWFKKSAAKKGIKPVNPGGAPLYWVGLDLWKFVNYQPKYVPLSVVKKSTQESLDFMLALRKRVAREARERRKREFSGE